jgi:chromate reductase
MAFQILGLSGSLRAASANTAVLEAARGLLPPGVSFELYGALGELPPFNPDIEALGAPPAAEHFQRALAGCGALLISSPEYAHGVPGVLKNALDWVVGSGELVGKPVGLVTLASPHAPRNWAAEQLVETLSVMSAVLRPAAILNLADAKKELRELGRLGQGSEAALRAALAALVPAS